MCLARFFTNEQQLRNTAQLVLTNILIFVVCKAIWSEGVLKSVKTLKHLGLLFVKAYKYSSLFTT